MLSTFQAQPAKAKNLGGFFIHRFSMNSILPNITKVRECLPSDANLFLEQGWILLQTIKALDEGSEYSKCLLGFPEGRVVEIDRVSDETSANKMIELGWKFVDTEKTVDVDTRDERMRYILAWVDRTQAPKHLPTYW